MVRHSQASERARVGRGCHTRGWRHSSLLRDQEPNGRSFNAFNNERFSHNGKFYTLSHRLEFPTSPVNGTVTGMRHPRVRSCRNVVGWRRSKWVGTFLLPFNKEKSLLPLTR